MDVRLRAGVSLAIVVAAIAAGTVALWGSWDANDDAGDNASQRSVENRRPEGADEGLAPPAYLQQKRFAICVDNPSERFDNSALRRAVADSVQFGAERLWSPGPRYESLIDVVEGCPGGPESFDSPPLLEGPQSRFSIHVVRVTANEAAGLGLPDSPLPVVVLQRSDAADRGGGHGLSFALYLRSTADENNVDALALRIGAIFGLPSVGAPPPAEFLPGDWARAAKPGCTGVLSAPPGGNATADLVTCLRPTMVLPIIDGPRIAGGDRYWALAGFGWVREDALAPDRRQVAAPNGVREHGLIAYVGAEGALWLMNDDGSGQTLLLDEPVVGDPLWSPDGRALAVLGHDQRLLVVDLAGEVLLEYGRVGSDDMAWSPDGQMIAAFSETPPPDYDRRLVVLRLDGSVVLDVPGNARVSWSDDGERLAYFEADPGGAVDGLGGRIMHPVYLELDRGVSVRLESGDGVENSYYQGSPTWRPGHPGQLSYRERLIDVEGGPEAVLPGQVSAWSPDGSLGLIPVHREVRDGLIDVLVYDVDAARELSRFELYACGCDGPIWAWPARDARFSSDGDRLAWRFTGLFGQEQPGELVVHNLLSGVVRRLPVGMPPDFPGDSGMAGFSPDGRSLLTVSAVYGAAQDHQPRSWVLVTNLDSGDITVLAEGSSAAWQPGRLDTGTS
ncbi:MAG: hypothetical protein GEU28_06250 [Dehalococcoidia bacterium]|nr:hypothetical protein [Dehalococcoidia bacterium]